MFSYILIFNKFIILIIMSNSQEVFCLTLHRQVFRVLPSSRPDVSSARHGINQQHFLFKDMILGETKI